MRFESIKNVKRLHLKYFDCGNVELNDYLFKYAHQNEKKHFSRTYVLMDDKLLIGYVTLCSAQIDSNEMPKSDVSLPRYPVPGIKIARLAVNKNHQGNHYGQLLLRFALEKAVSVSKEVGIRIVVVDAKEKSKAFYEKYSFIPLPNHPLTYVLEIETILKAFA